MLQEIKILLYIAKCVTGCLIMFIMGQAMSWLDISWVIISMLLVLSPDSGEAVPLAIVRVKANLVASGITIFMLIISPHPMMGICVALALTIIICNAMDLMAGCRAALAAVIIVSMHPVGEHLWNTAIIRVFSVVTGCMLALLLTFAFHRDIPFVWPQKNKLPSKDDKNDSMGE